MELEVDICEWDKGEWKELAERAAAASSEVALELENKRLVVSVLFTNDRRIQNLNGEWRGRDKPTNVLSFPMLARDELLNLATEGPPVLLGDIALAYETCVEEAAVQWVEFEHHVAHLIIHGLLHLAGYDHVDSDKEAEAMEALETAALAKMGIRNPYGP